MKRFDLLKSENIQTSKEGGGFQEGNVRVIKSVCKVTIADASAKVPKPEPACGLVWKVERLDDDLDPMKDDDGQVHEEQIIFNFGPKAIARMVDGELSSGLTPGKADSPTDEEPSDAGHEVGAEGNTVFVHGDFRGFNEHCGFVILMNSLKKSGMKSEIVDRLYFPDYEGAIFHMAPWADDNFKMPGNDGVKRAVVYKVVDKVVKVPGENKNSKGSSSVANSSSLASTEDDVIGAIMESVTGLRESKAGQSMSIKAFAMENQKVMAKSKVAGKIQAAALVKMKDLKFLEEYKDALGLSEVTKDNVTFEAA